MAHLIIIDAAKPSIVYTDSQGKTAGASSLTFSGMNFGTARGDRYMIAGLAFTTVSTTPSDVAMTIGGVAATKLITRFNGNTTAAAMFIAPVHTGTSGNVVITVSGGFNNGCGVGLWAGYGILSATPFDTASDTSTPLALSLNVPALGVVAGIGFSTGAGSLPGFSWSGLTEDFDKATNSPFAAFSGASFTATSAQTPLSASASVSGGGIEVGASASFR